MLRAVSMGCIRSLERKVEDGLGAAVNNPCEPKQWILCERFTSHKTPVC